MNRYRLLPDGRTVLLYLTRGQTTLIDARDLPRVLTMRWSISGHRGSFAAVAYVRGTGRAGNTRVYLHRFLLQPPEQLTVDHRNRNALDNRRVNLRLATRSENQANHDKHRGRLPSSRYKGVSLDRRIGRGWFARISFAHRHHQSPYFATEIEAALWYNEQAKILHGPFAVLNEVVQ